MKTTKMSPFFFIYFFCSTCCSTFISEFENKIHFQIHYFGRFWPVKYPQFFAQSYWFGQLIILYQKVDTLRLLKICIMFCLPVGAKYPFFRLQLTNYIWGSRKFCTELVCFFITFLVTKNSFWEPFWPVPSSAYYWILLICVATVQNLGKDTHLDCYVVDVPRSGEGRVFLFS